MVPPVTKGHSAPPFRVPMLHLSREAWRAVPRVGGGEGAPPRASRPPAPHTASYTSNTNLPSPRERREPCNAVGRARAGDMLEGHQGCLESKPGAPQGAQAFQ